MAEVRHGPSPAETALEQLREAIQTLHGAAGGKSSREMAKQSGGSLSHATINKVVQCRTLPTWSSLWQVATIMGGKDELPRLRTLWRAALSAGKQSDVHDQLPVIDVATPGDSGTHAAVRVFADRWVAYLEHGKVAAELLRGRDPATISVLAPLEQFLLERPAGVSVDVHTIFGSRVFPVRDSSHFWAVMLVDSILYGDRPGERRWLLAQTDDLLTRRDADLIKAGESRARLEEVWAWLFETYLRPDSPDHLPDLLTTLIEEVLTGADANRLFRMADFLLQLVRTDQTCVRLVREALQRLDDSLNGDVDPRTVSKVKTLIGKAGLIQSQGRVPETPFAPRVVRVGTGDVCTYPFEAMESPLTVEDVDTILRRRPTGAAPLKPMVFAVPGGEIGPDRVLARLTRQIIDIVDRCQDDAADGWRWDIPTAAEWLVLADCVDQPFPWGDQPPEPYLANLSFPNAPHTLQPVGSFRAGRSRHGALDCCGGVHEIVRVGRGEVMPDDFRLAGGSFRSPPASASCQKLRPLSLPARGGVSRQNLGLRLIRHHVRDTEARWACLRAYREGLEHDW